MKKTYLVPVLFAAIVLMACGNGQSKKQRDVLIDAVAEYGIDTIESAPQDTLYSEEVGSVLRHYPELYHAAQKVRKAYDQWVELAERAGQAGNAGQMDVGAMLDEALMGTADEPAREWPDLSPADTLYLRMVADEPDTARKSYIGRTRRAWKDYAGQLERLAQVLPADCRPRYVAAVAQRSEAYLNELRQYKSQK